MPIMRYQIRNEYSLADPELYLAANKDDPEALLEGVAMAGLVGVLRQFGDLSEFAAEIFHSLHEEVMVTAARGHSLTARVQQLEAELPLIEKAILSQTNHSSSFQTAGVEWHPNLRMNRNMITQGDLPRFVMDSYEECRGPPRLFILDKFDIAGAGSCLKRYTNPSFFKVEAASSGTPNVDSQRDRRIRKVKKKGARGRNGETPEILPTSTVKLHRLLLEDRAENVDSEPARLVKLKKRHLQGSPFDSQTGKSYLQKLFQTSPEHKFVRDIPIDPPSDSLISNSIENGPKILDIQTVSYATESLRSIRDRYVTPSAQETVQNSSMDEISEDVSDGENLHMAALGRDHEMNRMMSMLYKASDEKELSVDRKSLPESSVNESEIDVASETDNFMDALNSLESKIETDTESRRKNNLSLFNGDKHGTDSDANEEQNKNLSENRFLPYKKGTASSSYSDLNGLVGDESAEVAAVESVDTSFDKMCVGDVVLGTKSCQHSVANCRCSEVAEVPTIQAEHNKLPLDLGECSKDVSSVVSKRSFDADELGRGLLNTDTNGKNTKKIVPAMKTVSAVSSLTAVLPTESHHTKLDDSDPNASADALPHMPSGSDLVQEKNRRPNGVNLVMHTDDTDDNSCRSSLSDSSMHLISDSEQDVEDNCRENDENVGLYYRSKVSSAEEKILSSNIPDTLQRDVLHASTARNLVEPTPVVDNSPRYSSAQKTSQRTYHFHEHDNNQAESGVLHSEETTDTDGACGTKYFEQINVSKSNGDKIDSKIAPSILSSISPDNETHEDQVYKEHTVTRSLQAQAEDRMTVPSVAVSNENGSECSHLLLDIPCSSSRNSMDIQQSLSSSVDSHKNIVEMHDSSPPKCLVESDVPEKVTQFVACSGTTQFERHQNNPPFHDSTTSEVSSVQTEQETELDSHHPTRILDMSKTFGSVRTRPNSDLGYHTKQVVEEQAEQLDAGIPKFSFRHYEQIPDQHDISQDRYSSTSRGSSLEDLPGQASIANSSLQSTSVKLESSEKAMCMSLPFLPKLSLLPVPAMKTVNAVSSLTVVLPTGSYHTKLNESVPNASTDVLLHMPSGSDLDQEKNSRPTGVNLVIHTDDIDDNSCRSSLSDSSMHLISDSEQDVEDNCRENDENVGLYYRSKVSSAEEKILSSNIPDTLQRDILHASTARNLVEPTPVVDNSPSYSSSAQKTSQRTYNFHEQDNNQAESGVLHSKETTDTDGACGTKDFEQINGSKSNGDKIDSKKAPSILSSISPDNETHEDQVYKEHMITRNLQAQAEDRMIVPSVAVRNYNGSESSHLLLDIPCSSSRISMDVQESLLSSADSHRNIVEMHDSSPPQCHVESDVPEKVTQSVACSGPTQFERHPNNQSFHDSTSEVSSIQSEQETELDSHHPTRILDISKTFGSVRTRPTSDLGYHTKQVVEEQAEQLDAGIPKFSFRHYEQIPDQDDISQDRCSSTTRGSSIEDLPGQASIANSSLQSTSVKLESSEKAMCTSLPFFPKLSLLPVASEVSIVEPPQLPPLPPMQWRVGKLPYEHSFDSFPAIPSPTEYENDQSDTITSTENEQPHNPFLQPSDTINESRYVTEHFPGPSPLLLPIPTTISSSEENQDSSTLGDSKHSLNPFLSLPSSPERPQKTSLDVEEERTHHTSNVLPLEPPVEIANTAEDKELEHLKFQNSREKVSNLMLFLPPPLVENPQPQLGLQGPGEGNSNEDTTVKIPRPRNPLIDAVAAHGKNTLRKVAERARPPIEKEVEERDTLLEQIRNKTFNLKPAVPIRPRIQVPQTNLKMAAILEKANKIRQATVGSDEDNDDNWSDD